MKYAVSRWRAGERTAGVGLWMGACSDGLGNCREVSVAGTAPGSLEGGEAKELRGGQDMGLGAAERNVDFIPRCKSREGFKRGEKKGN